MKNARSFSNTRSRVAATMLAAALTLGLTGCAQALAHNGEVHRPSSTEFGFGPRASTHQLYAVTLLPSQALRLRQLQTVSVLVTDTKGQPVDGAAIQVDGGMPEHMHGLPTQPRVKRALGGGLYEIEGLRFSMGGWWELKLAIETPAGADRVTFNLDL